MVDREKVLHGISSCGYCDGIPNVCGVTECPYESDKPWCTHYLARDAGELIGELLKAQEPIEPVFERQFMTSIEIYDCGKCGTSLGAKGIAKYCMKCGQAVKW